MTQRKQQEADEMWLENEGLIINYTLVSHRPVVFFCLLFFFAPLHLLPSLCVEKMPLFTPATRLGIAEESGKS